MYCVVEVLLVGMETIDEVLDASPRLKQYLDSLPRVRIITRYWNGKLKNIPKARHCLVHCSDNTNAIISDLLYTCSQRGHVLFYNDKIITYGGRLGFGDLKSATKHLLKYLERTQSARIKKLKKESSTPSDE